MACRATLGRRSDGQGVELMLLAMNGPGRACSVWRSGSSDSFGAVLRRRVRIGTCIQRATAFTGRDRPSRWPKADQASKEKALC